VQKVFKEYETEAVFNKEISDQVFKSDGVTARISGDNVSILSFKRITLELSRDGEILKSVEIPLRLKLFKNVACAARELSRGTVVKESDVILLKKDITQIDESDIAEKADIIGKTLSKPLFKTGIFTRTFLLKESSIKRNSIVNVVVQSGVVTIRTTGKALNDAASGEPIRVSCDNGGIVTGKLTDDGSVLISAR